ncbi:MAG: hypothetical protein AAGA56_11340 [Myxococcota bacterium]
MLIVRGVALGFVGTFLLFTTSSCSDSGCETFCNARAECDERIAADVDGCVSRCEETVEGNGRDDMTDCDAIWGAAGECFEDNGCDACEAEFNETDRCE